MDSVLAVILGGGAGTRLFPLTLRRSKPAVPLGGKYRLIDIPVSNCINSGINRIFVLTQFNSASLNRHIASTYRFDRFGKGFVTILAAEQTPTSVEWFQGTADAVRQSLQHLTAFGHSHVIVLSGDQLYAMDYRRLLEHHLEHEADITIGTVPVAADDASAFGILKTDRECLITEFHEKPPRDQLEGKSSPVGPSLEEAGRVYLASMGIYVFNKEALQDILDEHPAEHDFGKELIPRAINSRRVISYPFTGYWSDIGTIRSFFEAHLMLASPSPPFDIYSPGMPLYTNARMLPPAKIQNSNIQDTLIAEACIIMDSNISNSVIGIRSFIGRNVTIKSSILLGSDYFSWEDPLHRDPVEGPDHHGVRDDAYIEGAIIDKNVRIGKRCVIRNANQVQEAEGPFYYIRDGLVVIPKNAEVPDDTVI